MSFVRPEGNLPLLTEQAPTVCKDHQVDGVVGTRAGDERLDVGADVGRHDLRGLSDVIRTGPVGDRPEQQPLFGAEVRY